MRRAFDFQLAYCYARKKMTPKAIDITINARIGNARIGVALSAAPAACEYVTGGSVCFVR